MNKENCSKEMRPVIAAYLEDHDDEKALKGIEFLADDQNLEDAIVMDREAAGDAPAELLVITKATHEECNRDKKEHLCKTWAVQTDESDPKKVILVGGDSPLRASQAVAIATRRGFPRQGLRDALRSMTITGIQLETISQVAELLLKLSGSKPDEGNPPA